MARRSSIPRWAQYLLYAFLFLVTVVWMVPIIVAVITSMRTNAEIMSQGFLALPEKINLNSYLEAWRRGGLQNYLPNSFIITIPSLVLTLLLASLSAYALARFRFKGNLPLYFMFVGGTMIPFQILLLPVFQLSDWMGIYDTYFGLIAIHTAFQLGFCTFVLRNYMMTVPIQVLESARMDGCTELGIWWKIMIPLTLPAFAAVATLEFTWIFNDYIWPLVLIRTAEKMPVTSGLAILQGQYQQDWTVIISGALFATVPTLVVFIFLQRYFIAGLTLGSSK